MSESKIEIESIGSRKWRYKRPRIQDLGNRGPSVSTSERAQKVSPESVAARQKKAAFVQKLQETFLQTKFSARVSSEDKWTDLDVRKSLKVRESVMFGKGKAPLLSTPTSDFDVIGFGVVMYFRFLGYALKVFLVMSIFALANAWICSQGTHIRDSEDIEAPNMYSMLSLGNLGSDTHRDALIDGSSFDFNQCGEMYDTFSVNGSRTGTALLDCTDIKRVPHMRFSALDFESWTSPLWDVGLTITLFDVAYSLVFLLAFMRFPHILKKMQHILDLGYLSASDYGVYVSGLPENFSTEDKEALRKHFSDLYDLKKIQSYAHKSKSFWIPSRREASQASREKYATLRRTQLYRPVENELPLQSVSNASSCRFGGGWVADLTLCLHNGDAIREHLSHLSLINKAQLAANMVRKYSVGSKFENTKRCKRWTTRFNKVQEKVKCQLRPILAEPAPRAARNRVAFLDEQSKVCGAFVIFEHQESQRRCLDDYKYFDTTLTRWQMPPPLQFKGHRISVKRAPEPSAIIWENLEASLCQKFRRRLCSAVITCALLLLSLTCITVVTSASLAKKKPELKYCGNPVMAAYYRPKSLNDDGVYNFQAMFHDFEPNNWVDFNASYGYNPINVKEGVDRCPDDYFEIRVKGAKRISTANLVDSTTYLSVRDVPSDQQQIGETDSEYIARLSQLAAISEQDATHVLVIQGYVTTTKHLGDRYIRETTYTWSRVRNLDDQSILARSFSESTIEEAWPPRKCRDNDNSPWLYGNAACDENSNWIYDLDALEAEGEDACFRPCFNPLDDDAECETFACTGLDPDIGQQCETFWAGTIPGCFCRDYQSIILSKLSAYDIPGSISAVFDMYDEYPICTAFGDVFSLGLDVIKVCIVAIINIVMTFLLCILAEYELHDSQSAKLGSIMIKDFIARLINTAFVLLLVQSKGIPGSALSDPGYATSKRDESNVGFFFQHLSVRR